MISNNPRTSKRPLSETNGLDRPIHVQNARLLACYLMNMCLDSGSLERVKDAISVGEMRCFPTTTTSSKTQQDRTTSAREMTARTKAFILHCAQYMVDEEPTAREGAGRFMARFSSELSGKDFQTFRGIQIAANKLWPEEA